MRRTSSFILPQVAAKLRQIVPDEHHVAAGRAVIGDGLATRAGEHVLVVFEQGYEELAAAMAMACDERDATVDAVQLGVPRLPNLERKLIERLDGVDVSVMIVSFTFPRDVRVVMTEHGIESRRHAHILGVNDAVVRQSLRADHIAVHDLGRRLITRLEETYEVRVQSAAGTSLRARRDPGCRWHNASGLQHEPGWTNLPGGEVVTCPLSVDGTFVCDGGVWLTDGTILDRADTHRLTLRFERGELIDVEGPALARQQILEDVDRHRHGRRVGQIVFGTNVGVVAPIGHPAQDTKLPGFHLVLGYSAPDATGATWNGTGMVTVLQRQDDVWLDARQIIAKGRYVTSLRPSSLS